MTFFTELRSNYLLSYVISCGCYKAYHVDIGLHDIVVSNLFIGYLNYFHDRISFKLVV